MEITYFKDIDSIIEKLKSREENSSDKIKNSVTEIIDDVKMNGKSAIVKYTRKFDCKDFSETDIFVTQEEIDNAYIQVDEEFLTAIKEAYKNIYSFHSKQKRNSWGEFYSEGEYLGMKISPLERVGLYVPGGMGGKTPLVSSVLMCGVPAKVAGVKDIIISTPCNNEKKVNPYLLVTADIIGIETIIKSGSAWGVAGLAYGFDKFKKVDKIVGPGNMYVTEAKKQLFGKIDIDMIAGPSEILIIGDEKAKPKYLAADFLSQAEHDTMAASILITNNKEIAEKTKMEIEKQLNRLKRKEIAEKSVENFGMIIVVEKIQDAFDISNEIAPEHLELQIENPFENISKIKNAGAIFLGENSPEPVGDYFAGPNHVLPTNMTSKFYSPLNVDDFIKKTSIIYYPKDKLQKNGNMITKIADVEGLDAHANSIKIRLEDEEK